MNTFNPYLHIKYNYNHTNAGSILDFTCMTTGDVTTKTSSLPENGAVNLECELLKKTSFVRSFGPGIRGRYHLINYTSDVDMGVPRHTHVFICMQGNTQQCQALYVRSDPRAREYWRYAQTIYLQMDRSTQPSVKYDETSKKDILSIEKQIIFAKFCGENANDIKKTAEYCMLYSLHLVFFSITCYTRN